MTGLVTMSRNWQDHDIFDGDEFSRRDAWAWLISQAAWKPTTTRIKGAKVELGRGELCFSQRFMAAKWGWSKSRVDRFIATLRDEGMIETRSKIGANADHAAGQGQSIIKVCNYDKYQLSPDAKRGNNEPASGATAGQQRGKEEEGNNTSPIGEGCAADLEKQFWTDAKAYLRPFVSGDPGAIVGKMLRDHGKELVRAAISAAQVERAVNPVEYCQGYFRRHGKPAPRGASPVPLYQHLAEQDERRTATAGGRG